MTERNMAEQRQMPQVELDSLLSGLVQGEIPGVSVSDLTLDSRGVQPGALFLACNGTRAHGLTYAPGAVEAGAVAVAYEPVDDMDVPELGVPAVAVPHLGQLSGRLAHRFFGAPSASLAVTGITGTNGKTTTAHLVASAFQALGEQAGFVGTIGAGYPGALDESALTTPDAVSVHRLLASFADAGAASVAMEVSSHALDQGRVAGVRFRNAVFTNLSRDHLDYHGSYEAYARAKASLFARFLPQNMIINSDDEFGAALASRVAASGNLVLTGQRAGEPRLQGAHRLVIESTSPHANGLTVHLNGSWGPGRIDSPLLGRFNASNLANALAVLLMQDVSFLAGCQALSEVGPPPGRMQAVRRPDSPLVIIDYAHTPDALANALRSLREHCAGQLWCVFGCGGDRDRGKRPQMAAAADSLADVLVITDDNPRTEAPEAIVDDMLPGVREHTAQVVHDRRDAIAFALAGADASDIVLIAGKGHEPYQIRGTERLAFDDSEVVREILGG